MLIGQTPARTDFFTGFMVYAKKNCQKIPLTIFKFCFLRILFYFILFYANESMMDIDNTAKTLNNEIFICVMNNDE